MIEPKSQALSENSKTVLSLFKDHNLRIVLQGHNHIYMNLYINGMHYLSGGSASYGTGGNDEGFLQIKIHNNAEDIRFVRPFSLKR